ncbi:DUF541 domain-containing protein [Stappia sp. GBMRC 2046]|uniref:DUF541 domain-containing protein n=1 Tax=Stappia sediminis TaxID=2692190 RepID=A0A7X3LQW6_9HYPH|nr:SIMPL domain-containing protein [Stappia sediminis]MXN63442.1 DUF541 domain-containing protein [Stappia sediminis]
MKTHPRPSDILRALGLAIAAAVMLATPLAAQEKEQPATISISGEGSVSAAPDVAMVTSGVVTDGKTAAEALAGNSEAMSEVVKTIKAAGIEARDIQTSGFSVSPRYERIKKTNGNETLEIVGYRVTNGVSIRVRDLEKLGGLLDAVVKDGANQVNGISFIVSDGDKRRDEARQEAMADAIRKAKIYTEAAGVKLGKVLSINENSYPVRPKGFALARAEAVSDAAPPVEAGESELSVQVNVTWELDQ